MLTPHFSLREMCASGTALRLGIKNEPSEEVVNRLQQLCEHVLEPLRQRFGVIRITSGYRCERLNRAVGGVKNSQHRLGEAADIHISDIEVGRKMFRYIQENLEFDQLLFEHVRENGVCWLHVSYKSLSPNPSPVGRGASTTESVLSPEWKLSVLKQQVQISVERLGEYRGILHSRRHLAASPLFKGIPNFRETRIRMLRAETVEELFEIMDNTLPYLLPCKNII